MNFHFYADKFMIESKIRKTENFHILLWLIKDLCWVSLSKTMGMIMIVPTIGLAVYITYANRAQRSELIHNLAVCLWIVANSIWMFGEFYLDDSTRNYAIVFFILGLAMMVRYYGKAFIRLVSRNNI